MAVSSTLSAYPRLREAEQLFREKKNDEASMVLIQHLREHQDEPRGLALLGEIAMESGALTQAEQFLRRAIALGANSYEVQHNLASVILKQDRLNEALVAFEELERRFDDLQLTAARANILDRLGRTEEALAVHQKIVADPRADSRHWIAYGNAVRFTGRTEDAIAAFRHVTNADAELGGAWWGLADIKMKILTDEDMRRMEDALEIAVDALNVEPLHMALGRARHDRGDYERAFHHYREGNRIRADIINYNPEELSKEIDELMRMSRPQPSVPASDGSRPIFLVSLPRSGSTLLEQILGRHPKIEATGELPYIRALMRSALEMRMRHGKITVPQLIANMSADEKLALGAEYMRRAALHRRTGLPFFIDKMPSNWSDILFIREILPEARFIEIRRNAMDCCFSNYTHYFGTAHAASFDLVHQARACIDYGRLMDHLGAVAPEMLCSIRYEALVDEPRAEIAKALAHLGLEWDDSLLSFHESDRVVRTPSAEQVRRPLNRSGIGTWKPYAEWLGPLRETLGPLADV